MNVSDNLRIVKYSGKSPTIDKISNEILRRSDNASITFEVFGLKPNKLVGFELNSSAILLFDRISSLNKFYDSMEFKARNRDFINILAYFEVFDKTWMAGTLQMHFNLVFVYISYRRLMLKTI